ncbi:hypothetical protein [Aliikangiella sp. G2MR2-5]|uniref:hypothetical protein n=1 Tax=Aliikangiella sp. G2MR2-5 TaxID=2788943 RepID=UPI0018A9D55F|nr:hypothetical protein [Aliikangiella sp. G2MR2-5]
MKRNALAKATLAFLSLLSVGASAGEYTYSIFNNSRFSDNIAESASEVEESGQSYNTGISFRILSDPSTQWQLQADGRFSREIYSQDGLEGQNYKLFSGSLVYQPRSSNFSLRIMDELSQTPRNRFSSQSVNNVRDNNIFTVASSYFYRWGSLDRVYFDVSYSDTNSDDVAIDNGIDSDSDGQSESAIDGSRTVNEASISYERQLNSTNLFYLFVEASEIDFDADFNFTTGQGARDYEQQDAYIRWVVRGRATRIQVDLGRSNIEDVLGYEADAGLSEVIINRQINRTHALEFTRRTGFDNLLDANFADNSYDLDSQANDLFSAQEITETRAAYSVSSETLNAVFSLHKSDLKSVNSTDTEERSGFELNLSYPVSRLFHLPTESHLSYLYRLTDSDFSTSLSDITDTRSSLSRLTFTYQYNANLALLAEIERRSSQDKAGIEISRDTDSTSLVLGFTYSPSGRF